MMLRKQEQLHSLVKSMVIRFALLRLGPKSLELCGGTHATRSGDIGFLMLASEGGISSGVRRIECWAGLVLRSIC